jgi:hypothetical protein
MLIMLRGKIERNMIVESECSLLKKDFSVVFVSITIKERKMIKKINITCFKLFCWWFFILTLKCVK